MVWRNSKLQSYTFIWHIIKFEKKINDLFKNCNINKSPKKQQQTNKQILINGISVLHFFLECSIYW